MKSTPSRCRAGRLAVLNGRTIARKNTEKEAPKMSALARNNDPATSHAAAAAIKRGGSLAVHNSIILTVLERFSDLTTAEISTYCRLDRYQVARRMARLKEKGKVVVAGARECSVVGSRCQTWSRSHGAD